MDLRVVAGVTGYRQVLVVKSREAAANPALREVTFRVSGDGVRLRNGARAGIEAVDGKGELVFASSGASMWDSPVPAAVAAGADDARRAAAQADRVASEGGEPTPRRLVDMPVRVSASGLTVRPDVAMLTAADTVFPVFIDPPFSKPSPVHWTNVMNRNPNHAYYGEYSDIRVGRQWQTSDVWRSHMQFNIAEMAGSTIISSSMHITADHTADCASTSIELWQTARFDNPSTYTWYNDSDGDWMARVDTETFSANESTCPKADDPGEFTGSLKTKLQAQATSKAPTMSFGLRATSESNQYEWTRFIASSVSFQATYNRPPNTPTNQAITDCYLNCTSNPLIGRKDPELSVFATDPDAATILTVYFEVQTSTGVPVASGVKTGYASGPTKPAQPAKWRVTPLLGDGSYRWRARSKDEQGSYSGWTTNWFAFTTDSTAPAPPTISPTDPALYFQDDGSGACSGGLGAYGYFALSGESSVAQFTWALDGGSYSSPITPTGTTTKTATILVQPLKDMVRTLHVRAYDGAGRYGETSHEFRVCSPEPQAGHWKLDNRSDDEDIVTQPHFLGGGGLSQFVQNRYAAEEYTMSESAVAYLPANQTVLPLTGDDAIQRIDLPFPIRFYGGSYTEAWIDTNGILSFAAMTESLKWYEELPYGPDEGGSSVSPAAFPFWADLRIDAQSSIRTAVSGSAPNRVFVVEWRNVNVYGDPASRLSFEVQLAESGKVVFAYADVDADNPIENGWVSMTGIQNAVGTKAVKPVYGRVRSDVGFTFTPTGFSTPDYPEGYREARFDATSGEKLTTNVPVLATGLNPETNLRRSFAVAGWIRVTDTSTSRTAISQQGANRSMFELGYQAGSFNNYCFTMSAADAVTATTVRACATAPVIVGEWVHLAGVYDGPAGTMTLSVHHKDAEWFVDPARTEVVTQPFTSVWDATGTFTIGGAFTGASFDGDIDEVWAWQRAPEQSEIEFLAAN
ncbi:LamG domain-containing protein [Micromonospora sp. NPDC050495]|uniref:LamG domain-containing protein n=1 Tax=Micromonospora sp. NPDC050495 TaxID=3154936 RepID=UPI0034093DC7